MTALWVLLLMAGPSYLFWLAIVFVAGYGLRELYRITLGTSSGISIWPLVAVSLLPVLAAIIPGPEIILAALFVSLLGSVLLVLVQYGSLGNGLQTLCSLCIGTLYVSFCLAHLVLIRSMPEGIAWLLVLSAVTAGGDTGAYYIGRAIGRHKLCPVISPGKTIEGAIGGILAGSVCAVMTGLYFLPQTSPFLIVLAAVLLSLVGIAGDLTESIIKRSAGLKDSGTLLFGHGGVLDRIDSLLLAGPVLYFFLFYGMLA